MPLTAKTTDHDGIDLDFNVAYRLSAAAARSFEQSSSAKHQRLSRYRREGRPALKGIGGMHRRGNKRHGL